MKDLDISNDLPDFLYNRLSESERKKMQAEIDSNEQLRDLYKDMMIAKDALEVAEHQAIKNIVNEQAALTKPAIVPMQSGVNRRWKWRAMAAGFLVLLVAGIVWWANSQYGNSALISQHSPNFVFPVSTVKGNSQGVSETLRRANDFYQKQEFENAINELSKFNEDNKAAINEGIFLKGKVYLDAKNYEMAIFAFNEYFSTGDKQHTEYAHFYLAQAHLGNGEEEEAVKKLEYILANPNDFSPKFEGAAKGMLADLQSNWRNFVFFSH